MSGKAAPAPAPAGASSSTASTSPDCAGPLTYSTHDPACDHCRVKKIRCGRERPMCNNCKRDGIECGFSDRAKRVNHTKLLVSNVGELDERLRNIEKSLLGLHSSVQNIENYISLQQDRENPPSNISNERGRQATETITPPDGAVEQLLDRYVTQSLQPPDEAGAPPDSVFDLSAICDELHRSITSIFRDQPDLTEHLEPLLSKLLGLGRLEENLNIDRNNCTKLIPPRQLLAMACLPFFQTEEFAIDVFCQSSFWTHVDRIYNVPVPAGDNAWAVCFSIIILLGLGSQRSNSGTDSEFLKPFLSNAAYGLRSTALLLTAKLINVQTLALLSVIAQQYFGPGISHVILEQACILAKRVIAQFRKIAEDSISAQDMEALHKVITTLYVRNQSLCLFHGKKFSFSASDYASATMWKGNESSDSGKQIPARLALARIQEQIYISLYSPIRARRLGVSRTALVAALNNKLCQWAAANDEIISKDIPSRRGLHITFRSSRIMVLRLSAMAEHRDQILQDSRVCCQILGASQTGMRPPISSIPLHHSTEILSPSVFLPIFDNILRSGDADEVQSDMYLIEQVGAAFSRADRESQIATNARILSQMFQIFLAIVHTIKSDDPGSFITSSLQYTEKITRSNNSNMSDLKNEQFQFGAIDHCPGNASIFRPPAGSDTKTPSSLGDFSAMIEQQLHHNAYPDPSDLSTGTTNSLYSSANRGANPLKRSRSSIENTNISPLLEDLYAGGSSSGSGDMSLPGMDGIYDFMGI